MNNIHILDCTLRDGGYCNGWKFGFDNIHKITCGLQEAGIEIIECGFLTNKVVYNQDITKFTNLNEISEIIPDNKEDKIFVAMMNFGEYDIADLPVYDGSSIDGIRVAFHKKNRDKALDLCEKIKAKGYLVFIQAMVSLSYTDDEFLALISNVNKIKPYAFYIVDSFGMMKSKDLTRLFYMVEHNLEESIWIGFHSHNNMQLAYSNAQRLTRVQTTRNLIIDSSVYGMGRGAGNLNTELFVEYLNENIGKKYLLKPLLRLIDEILNDFYQKNYWGYSLPNYISATHNVHPDYAGYLDEKKTLTFEEMNDIFAIMDEEKKVSFDRLYIEDLYLRYMARDSAKKEHEKELNEQLRDKEILLIAPGKSSIAEKKRVIDLVDKRTMCTISINYAYEYVKPDFIFVSNLRRFKELDPTYYNICIVTSNIPCEDTYYKVKYRDLLLKEEMVRDNAGLMAIKFLILQGVNKIFLVGFDGYSHDTTQNYAISDMELIQNKAYFDGVNNGMSIVLREYSKQISIEYVTTPKYISV